MPEPTSGPDPIDRSSPTLRPARRAIMRQNWHHLLFLHWEVPAEMLRPLLPPGLELDLYEGKAYVGLVPFTMTGVRPVWAPPLPLLSRTHEVNVRTYVHRNGRDPGVWFFSLDAANAVAVWAARTFFHLNYFSARMSLELIQADERPKRGDSSHTPPTIAYRSERRRDGPSPAGCSIRYSAKGLSAAAAVGTLDHFLIERYILYAAGRGWLYRGQVHHAAYPIQAAVVPELEETLVAAAGIRRPAEAPLAHYARGVRVEIFGLERVGEDRR